MNNPYEMNPIEYLFHWFAWLSPAAAFAFVVITALTVAMFVQAIRNSQTRRLRSKYTFHKKEDWQDFEKALAAKYKNGEWQ